MRKLLILIILLLAFLFYKEVLGLYFTSDDFFYTALGNFSDALKFYPSLYHFSPVFFTFMMLIRRINGPDPFIFHLITLLLHLINGLLVYHLSGKLFKDGLVQYITLIIFLFFFSHYEVVYWVTGIHTSLMSAFYLAAIGVSLEYFRRRKLIYPGTKKTTGVNPWMNWSSGTGCSPRQGFGRYHGRKSVGLHLILFYFISTLAIFTHEYALSLPVAVFIFNLLLYPKEFSFRIYIYPLVLMITVSVIKLFYMTSSPVAGIPEIGRFMASAVKSLVYLFFPFPQFLDTIPKVMLVPFCAILVFLIIYRAREDKIKLWLFIWISLIIALYSATSLPQARYFYTASFPATLLLISILNFQNNKYILRKSIFILLVVISNMEFLNTQKIYWIKSSQIIKKVITFAINNQQTWKTAGTVYFLDLPDSVNGPPWNAYTFRSGLEKALEINGVVGFTVKYGRTVRYDEIVRNDAFLNQPQIDKMLRDGNYIYKYAVSQNTVIPLDEKH